MRVLPALIAMTVFAAPAFAEKPAAKTEITFQENTYRFGDLYRSERGSTVEACAQMCTRDSGCASWSLTPATFRIGPRCELKASPGEAITRPGAASGMSEVWQMDPARHANMRYQPSVPASRQPAAVPLDQLRPSPVPRMFGDPLPAREPELLGAPTAQVSAVRRTVKAVSPVPKQTVEVYRGPGEGKVPEYVKQPAPPQAKPISNVLVREAPQPVAQPVSQVPAQKTPQPSPQPAVQPVFKDPARKAATPTPVAGPLNAVVKRKSQVAPVSVSAPSPAAPSPQPALVSQPEPLRVPWTERDGTTPNYSVGGSGYVPGDEDATAGFVEGAPEAGT